MEKAYQQRFCEPKWDGWKFGVILQARFGTIGKISKPQLGHAAFFIDSESFAPLLAKAHQICPDATRSEIFRLAAFPHSMRRLLSNYRSDWRSRMRGMAATETDRGLNYMICPSYKLDAIGISEPDPDVRFAFIQSSLQSEERLDDELAREATLDAASHWRKLLDAQGVATMDWVGPSLLIGNGFLTEDLMGQARSEAAAQELGLLELKALGAELPTPSTPHQRRSI